MKNIKSIKYFNNLESTEQNIIEDNLENLNEKIKLEFFLQNTKENIIYCINAELIDRNGDKYFSEKKSCSKNNNIMFENFYVCDYYFEKEQKIQIIISRNNSKIALNTTLGCIVGSRYCTFIRKLETSEILIIKAEKMGKSDLYVNLKYSLTEKYNKFSNYFKKNKIMYVVTCKQRKIYSSELIDDEGNFNNIEIPAYLLKPFFTVNLYNKNNQLIYNFDRKVEDINPNLNRPELEITISNNQFLYLLDNSEIKEHFTFLDFIAAGVRIGLSIGIDFTGSNGHPLDKGTLHYINGPKPSDYERAIRACGDIVAYYDYDQLFPVYGFGAILNSSPIKEASMCFNLNFQFNPDIYTIDNIIKTYHECIEKEKLTFSGPTEFSHIINKVISKIQENKLEYHILMILTDGVINDLQETIDALVEGSFLPLSVIIIGIGNADFKEMEILDGDDVPLISSTGKKRMRDLVQFVPFNKFENDEKKLSLEVLEEIPRQIVDYYTINNLNPNKIKQILLENNKNEHKNEYSEFDFEKAEFNWDEVPLAESVLINDSNNNNKKEQNEIHVKKEKDNDKIFTNLPLPEYNYYDNQNDNKTFSLFNKDL